MLRRGCASLVARDAVEVPLGAVEIAADGDRHRFSNLLALEQYKLGRLDLNQRSPG